MDASLRVRDRTASCSRAPALSSDVRRSRARDADRRREERRPRRDPRRSFRRRPTSTPLGRRHHGAALGGAARRSRDGAAAAQGGRQRAGGQSLRHDAAAGRGGQRQLRARSPICSKAGADPNAVLPEGETVLMTAARTGRVEALTVLLEGGADLDGHENWFGETPLIWAAAEDHAGAVRLLIARGADVNWRSARQTIEIAARRPVDPAARQLDAADVRGARERPRGRTRAHHGARRSRPRRSGRRHRARHRDHQRQLRLRRSCCSTPAPIRTSSTTTPTWGRSTRRSTCTAWRSDTADRTRSPPARSTPWTSFAAPARAQSRSEREAEGRAHAAAAHGGRFDARRRRHAADARRQVGRRRDA